MTAISQSGPPAQGYAPPTPTPPTSHRRLLAWAAEVAALTEPEAIYWCDGSEAEWAQLTDTLVETGTLIRLNPAAKPNSFLARSDLTMSPGSRTAPSSARPIPTTPDRPTTG